MYEAREEKSAELKNGCLINTYTQKTKLMIQNKNKNCNSKII